MNILAIDTSSVVASVCVMNDEKLLGEYYLHNGLTHSQTLLPLIDSLVQQLKLSISDIDYFAVNIGPGSFTGLRIGIATAKGLAHATNKLIVPICTLDSIAYTFKGYNKIIVPIMDARRSQVYTAVYDDDFNYIVSPSAIAIDELLTKLEEYDSIIFCGDGINVHKEIISNTLGDKAIFANSFNAYQHASVCAKLALMNIDTAIKPHALTPTYLRKSQAERELEERENKK